jgi:hypothetical protein
MTKVANVGREGVLENQNNVRALPEYWDRCWLEDGCITLEDSVTVQTTFLCQ